MVDNKRLCGLIGLAMKAGKLVAGTDACLEQMEKKTVKIILVAQDASERTKTKFEQEAKKCNIPIYKVLSIDEISKAMGKNNKAVIGIKEAGFSNKIMDIIRGGEQIG